MKMLTHLGVLILLPLLNGCQERQGNCPTVSSVEPAEADSLEVVTISGQHFELGHQDLWDEANALPPEVYLDVSLRDSIPAEFESMFTEEELADLETMDMTLTPERVALRSATELEVTLPDLTWSDIESSAEMYGAEMIELPSFLTSFPMSSTVRVINPAGCEGKWSETFTLNVPIDDQDDDGGEDEADAGIDAGTDSDVEGDA